MSNSSLPKKRTNKRIITTLSPSLQSETENKVNLQKIENPDAFNLPESKRSIDDLYKYFLNIEDASTRILPKEKRRYVIYLRKSTDDELKQVRSLDDQKLECLDLARRLGVNVRKEDIFEEAASAKISGNRPIFSSILNGFMTGKYHGLLAWSPDRLSRNMKEAGEIIEMIDLEYIQDLHFKTYQFDNTPNGKMLLGILFATSKQYSDKLAVDVSRGITGSIREGKYVGLVKKGYYADTNTGYFIPDSFNWNILREAVNLRLYKGKTNQEVADFLNNSHFSYRKDETDDYKIAKMDKKSVGLLFNDPFYFGLYKYGNRITNLTEIYNFLPLITPDEFVMLSKNVSGNFDEEFVGKKSLAKRLEYGLLREKVICDYCDKIMQFQRTKIQRGKNQGKWFISYYCRNKECIRHKPELAKEKYGHELNKSVRAKVITAYIEWTLRSCTIQSKKAYKLYIDRLNSKLAVEKEIAKRKLTDAKSQLKTNEEQYHKYQNFQLNSPEDYKKHHKGKLEYYSNLMNVNTASIEVIQNTLDTLNLPLPDEKEFYELTNSYLKILLNTQDLVEEDAVYTELVSNLRVADNSVSVIKLNPPYNLLVDLVKISTGRGERT